MIEVSQSAASDLENLLKRYKVRSQVSIQYLHGKHTIWSLWGRTVNKIMYQHANKISNIGENLISNNQAANIICFDNRKPGLGLRIITLFGMKPFVTPDFNELPGTEYTIRRILHGIPEGINDLFIKTSLPLESNFDYMGGVDFRKGCYIGQELTIRTYHNGVIRKRIVPVQIATEEDLQTSNSWSVNRSISYLLPSPRSDIIAEGGEVVAGGREKSIGKFCGGFHNIGLALMRLQHIKDHNHQWYQLKNPALKLFVRPHIPEWWPKALNGEA